MKKRFAGLLCIVLLFSICSAMADTFYVATDDGSPLSLRDEFTNQVLTTIPYGTPLMPDPEKSTDMSAYVTYEGQSGMVLWRYLSRMSPDAFPGTDKPEPIQEPAVTVPTELPTEPPTESPRLPDGQYQLRVIGALITVEGSSQPGVDSMVVSVADNVTITAQIPRNATIDSWIINGVRYDFRKNIRILRMTKFDTDFTIEVLYANAQSETLMSPETIQAARTGKQLVVETRDSRLSHIKSNGHSGGGWMQRFDFTEDYMNLATGAEEKGGQISIRVQAEDTLTQTVTILGDQITVKLRFHVPGWKFNQTEVYPNVDVSEFVIYGLNTSMVYEPILGAPMSGEFL